ncbi:TonB family protein [Blochmannia endosymbiont of Camponotus modoc]|uniref:TonB family protein n=1 Tax=Blochmannia endosymbiont of Camponotus modoc TaxID=2945587 RepID=UPI002024824C|nr:TonB family protein [Blochmannia endosymbiont of Camponotus modoc]URJ26360.1 TonB family protein [Blochmannia endosymbiont of Camponotus modoc]
MKYDIFLKKIKDLIIDPFQRIWRRLHMSIYFCCFLSCVIHVFVMHVLLYYCHHSVNQSVCAQRSNIMTLSLLQTSQIFHESLEKNQLSKTLKTCHKQQNSRSIIRSEKKILDSSKYTLNADKNLSSVEKNNVNIGKSTTHSVHVPEKHQDRPYISSCIINCVYPEYPNRAKILNIAGKIIVQYDVNTRGKVDNICILSAVPSGVFEESIRSAMRRWVYESNKPEKKLIITFKFCLNSVKMFCN